jgi:hypothetical protein
MQTQPSWLRSLGYSFLAIVSLGCSAREKSSPFQRYVPDAAQARRALESVLTALQGASTPSSGSPDQPGVKFVDQHRPPGQRLRGFQILGGIEVENARQFTVRMIFDLDDAPALVRYNVFGRDPIWVYRLEDYELISHWEHKMDEPSPPQAPAPPPGQTR